MSDNNLVNIKGMSDEQIMQIIGQDDGSNAGTNIPRLSINRNQKMMMVINYQLVTSIHMIQM
tara:strand:- start:84 stop:269 length:186 start_codon:yes stop_codon:yes gene_type:complete